MIASGSDSQADFYRGQAVRLHEFLTTRGHLRGVDARLARFLIDNRLSHGADLSVSGYRGLAVSRIDTAPEPFRKGIELVRQAMIDERSYRMRTGERIVSERRIYDVTNQLVGWAIWMDAEGSVSWQQLTPTAFRKRVRELGIPPGGCSIPSHLGVLQAVLRELFARRLIFFNPLSGFRLPYPKDVLQRPLDDGAIGEWLRLFADDETDPVLRLGGLLVTLHGMSQAELRVLKLRDFDRRRRTLRLVGRGLTLELDPLSFDAIACYLRVRPKATRNEHLLVSARSRMTLGAVSSGFLDRRFHGIGLQTRAVKQHLIRQLATEDGALVAARYFGTRIEQVRAHLCQQTTLNRESKQEDTDCIQENL